MGGTEGSLALSQGENQNAEHTCPFWTCLDFRNVTQRKNEVLPGLRSDSELREENASGRAHVLLERPPLCGSDHQVWYFLGQ